MKEFGDEMRRRGKRKSDFVDEKRVDDGAKAESKSLFVSDGRNVPVFAGDNNGHGGVATEGNNDIGCDVFDEAVGSFYGFDCFGEAGNCFEQVVAVEFATFKLVEFDFQSGDDGFLDVSGRCGVEMSDINDAPLILFVGFELFYQFNGRGMMISGNDNGFWPH